MSVTKVVHFSFPFLVHYCIPIDNSANKTYFDNATIPNEAEADWRKIEYPDLDFFVSLEDGKKVFLRKYEIAPGNYRFVRNVQIPLIKDLFSMVRALWMNEAGWKLLDEFKSKI